jgi:hypothetical protein
MKQKVSAELDYTGYKEPLKTVEEEYGEGFGYMGVLATTVDRTQVQCHECGELYEHLGAHAYGAHNLLAKDYREKFGLAKQTPLASQARRQKLIESYNDSGRSNLPDLGYKGRRNRDRFQPKLALETDNKRGTCPDQTIARIRGLAKKLGHTPSPKEYKNAFRGRGSYSTVIRHWGSWAAGMKAAGLTPKGELDEFKNQGHLRYTDEDLLKQIKGFFAEHNRTPSWSDFRKGDLADPDTFKRRFKSLNGARKAAGVPIVIQIGRKWVETLDY